MIHCLRVMPAAAASSGRRKPVTLRRLSSQRAALTTSAAVTASIRSGQDGDILERKAGGERSAIPLRQRHLTVLRIDRIGDEPRLGAGKIGLV